MSDLTNKDSEQDAKLAVLESKIESYRERIIALEGETKDVSVIDSTLENAIRRIEMVHSRIDKTEEKIKEHMSVYGAYNDERLTGLHET